MAGPTWLDGPRAPPSTPSSPPQPASPSAPTGSTRSSKPPLATPEASRPLCTLSPAERHGSRRLESVRGGKKEEGKRDGREKGEQASAGALRLRSLSRPHF